MMTPRPLIGQFHEPLGFAVDLEATYLRLRRAIIAVRSGRATADEVAAELAADPAVGLPVLFARTLLDHPGALFTDRDWTDSIPRQLTAGDSVSGPVAAWMPSDPERAPEAAAFPAVDWILRRARESGLPAIVLSPDRRTENRVRAFERLRSQDRKITPLARGDVIPGAGPLLAYLPGERAFDLAVRLAAGRPLCVVESTDFSVDAWARQVGALDLSGIEAPGSVEAFAAGGEITDEVRESK